MLIPAMSSKEFGSCWAPERLLEDHGPGLIKMADNAEFDFRHDATGARIELKAARARSSGFTFQYIRPDCFDICVCLRWENGTHRYWLIPATKIRPFLSIQHRSSNSFQLRAGSRSATALAKYDVTPPALRDRLEALAISSVQHRRPVRLDPILATIEGWAAVSASITRQMKECGVDDWSFVLKPLTEPVDPDESDLLPYPAFYEKEQRIEVWVHPEPVIGKRNIYMTADRLFGFLIQYLDTDDIDSVDDSNHATA